MTICISGRIRWCHFRYKDDFVLFFNAKFHISHENFENATQKHRTATWLKVWIFFYYFCYYLRSLILCVSVCVFGSCRCCNYFIYGIKFKFSLVISHIPFSSSATRSTHTSHHKLQKHIIYDRASERLHIYIHYLQIVDQPLKMSWTFTASVTIVQISGLNFYVCWNLSICMWLFA